MIYYWEHGFYGHSNENYYLREDRVNNYKCKHVAADHSYYGPNGNSSNVWHDISSGEFYEREPLKYESIDAEPSMDFLYANMGQRLCGAIMNILHEGTRKVPLLSKHTIRLWRMSITTRPTGVYYSCQLKLNKRRELRRAAVHGGPLEKHTPKPH